MAIGAGIGALTNKRDPFKGALLGAGMGALGGAGAAAMGGAGAAGAAGGVGGGTGLLGGAGGLGISGTAGGVTGLTGAAPSLIPASMGTTASGSIAGINAANPSMWSQLKDGMSVASNVGNAAKVAGSLLGPEQQAQMPMVTTPPPIGGQGGSQSLSALAQGDMNKSAAITGETDLRRRRRQSLLGG
jgi:hypothetical protein